MEISFYENLKQSFINIRRLSTDGCYDEILYNKTLADINNAGSTLVKEAPTIEVGIILYCIDTLFAISREDNREKLYDFADTIHNIPDIACTKRKFKSFNREIEAFRKKYGKEYFADFDNILTNRIITPLSVGIFNLVSPIPVMIVGIMLYWHTLTGIGMEMLGYKIIPAWFAILAFLPVFISPVLTLAGIIYGFTRRTKKHRRLCIVMSAIGLAVNIIFILSTLVGTSPV